MFDNLLFIVYFYLVLYVASSCNLIGEVDTRPDTKMVNHVNFIEVMNFLRYRKYPEQIQKDKGKRANFRKACKHFTLNGQMFYKHSRLVISSREEQRSIIKDTGLGEDRIRKHCHHIEI